MRRSRVVCRAVDRCRSIFRLFSVLFVPFVERAVAVSFGLAYYSFYTGFEDQIVEVNKESQAEPGAL